ncbi:MAG: preprotein translocase, YajC subunit [Verrucomicrobiales bacterium]|nr:preprotein translocase, YajC subunit [Verrucomicrobiales bacterium]
MIVARLQMLAMGNAQNGANQPWFVSMGPMIVMVVVFYLVFIRPQQKKSKEMANLLKALKTGDRVETSSGIIGTVVSVRESSVCLRSEDAKMEVSKSSIAKVSKS